MNSVRDVYPLKPWRPFFDIGLCYSCLFLSIWAGLRWPIMIPISMLINANRLLALSLICHEGLHGSLFNNKKLNNIIGRWFCAFPTCISFSKYKKLHLIHHTSVGNPKFDPDIHLYNFFPVNKTKYFFKQLHDLLSLKTTYQFLLYYTEIIDFLKTTLRKNKKEINQKLAAGDFISFTIFFSIGLFLIIYYNLVYEYLIFYLFPLLLITQPYVLLMGGLQHGPLKKLNSPELTSRSIRGPKYLMESLLPLNINYHAEHHYNSAVPHYWLKKYSIDLENQGLKVWKENYTTSLKALLHGN